LAFLLLLGGLVSGPFEILNGELAVQRLLDFQLRSGHLRVCQCLVILVLCLLQTHFVHRLKLLLFERLLHLVNDTHRVELVCEVA